MIQKLQIGAAPLTYLQYEEIAAGSVRLELDSDAAERIEKSRHFLEEYTRSTSTPIYGVNTGFGALCNVEVDATNLSKLQTNLVRSHACGAGSEISTEIVRLMMALKIQSFAVGVSGIRLEVVRQILSMYNSGAVPVIYELGSLGASGDLAPLAHMSLPLLGEGEVRLHGVKYGTKKALAELGHNGWDALTLASKEGLALLNGTQFMSAHGIYALIQARRIDYFADQIAAMSTLAYDGRIEPFTPGVHLTRPHLGQIMTAKRLHQWLEPCLGMHKTKEHVQDPYSFRCIPQVHGASKGVIRHVMSVFEVEVNSATDNPVVLSKENAVVSAGNFHGQPLALALDYAAMAIHEYGSISERRVYQLISGSRGLPPFLVKRPGINSGLMIAQYTAASMVSQNKQLCAPACVDSIESSNGQEDHVSMGANAATKLLRIISNVYGVLGIELLNAVQALWLRGEDVEGELGQLYQEFLEISPAIEEDVYLHSRMELAKEFLKTRLISDDSILL
ncbi:MAG: histidine ammonia-lyase [Flavobacteriales bacterium]|nr:histidine ammonia-lyase [Flavobacteriales bacterium]